MDTTDYNMTTERLLDLRDDIEDVFSETVNKYGDAFFFDENADPKAKTAALALHWVLTARDVLNEFLDDMGLNEEVPDSLVTPYLAVRMSVNLHSGKESRPES